MKAPLYRLTVPSWGQDDSSMTEPSKLPHRGVPEHQPAAGGIAARARAAAGPQYLNGLNPEQRDAVETLDGPVLVLAGAGTGKTRVLTTRIAHILSQGRARPHEILSVTFTNKAAREMKLRLGQMLGQAVEGMPWLGTFHSIGGRILRFHAELVQLKSNFTVLDVDDQVRLLKQLLQAENIDDKRWPARMLAGLIDGWKNRGLTPSQVPAGEAAMFGNGKGGKLYASYQERLKILNAADFGDLLLENIRLFREHPDVLRQYQNRFKFILVDEYQDTNVAQYLWLRLLSQAPSRPGVPLSAIIPGQLRTLAVIPGRVEDANPESRDNEDSSRDSGSALSAHPGMTETCCPSARRSPQEHLLRRRRRPVDLWLARRGGRQHPALRSRFSRRKSHPPRTQLPLHRPHPRRRLASDRAQRRPSRQDAAHRGCRRREGHRHRLLGFGRGSPRHRRRDRGAAARRRKPQRGRDPGAGLVPDARVRRSFRHARPALSRDRRSAVL